MKQNKTFPRFFAIFLLLLAILFIIIIYTFYNAKGISYFSDASEACNNCHVMNEVYDDYLKGPHAQKVKGEPRATCNDCHLPHNFISKWIAKAESGVGHAYAFTFKLNDLPPNLNATQKSKEMIQNNCMSCHTDMASHAINATMKKGANEPLRCVSCHVGVGHKQGM
ncbi:cytochrome c nitrite reductase small subunit [Helicobacter didelphidarum]|uniref:Cytochrome c-type protein n=1 Tax=Helicobacter didelphidarum TaxID=2040648 RepID=A0A3D8IQN0_9HELI|nr:cytochrome c nitrite reductase small subunit [Helicobacter didelphidarum]RDU67588.1 cytochrome c nitrite reductase small subunit [Helicobacter didelphidarum]